MGGHCGYPASRGETWISDPRPPELQEDTFHLCFIFHLFFIFILDRSQSIDVGGWNSICNYVLQASLKLLESLLTQPLQCLDHRYSSITLTSWNSSFRRPTLPEHKLTQAGLMESGVRGTHLSVLIVFLMSWNTISSSSCRLGGTGHRL